MPCHTENISIVASKSLCSTLEALTHHAMADIWVQPEAGHEPHHTTSWWAIGEMSTGSSAITTGSTQIWALTQLARPGSCMFKGVVAYGGILLSQLQRVYVFWVSSVHSIGLLRKGALLAAFLAKSAAFRSYHECCPCSAM